MELIWTEQDFSRDAKKRLGFVDADLSFNRLESILYNATSEVVDLIGSDNYTEIKSETTETEFGRLVKYAILLKALIIYVPTSDIAFTNRGRKLRTDEHDGTPWQWMIDANDKALNNLYYRHLDIMLRHMFTHNKTVNISKYNHKDLLVNSLDAFEKHFNINGSYLVYLKLLPALRDCEDLELQPRVFSITEEQFATIKDLAQKACVFYALDWGLRRLNIEIFPDGIFQTSWNTGGKTQKPSDKLQYLETAMIFKEDCNKYLLALEKRVAKALQVADPHPDKIVMDLGFSGDDNFIDT